MIMYSNPSSIQKILKTPFWHPFIPKVEFLRTQIVEKDLLIRSLIIKESDIFNYESSRRNDEVKTVLYQIVETSM